MCCASACRNIGTLARSIKSRVKPETNLINRYRLSSAVMRSPMVEESGHSAMEPHPLVPLGEVPSADGHALKEFPIMTKNNSRFLFNKRSTHKRVERVLWPLLGEAICQRNKGRQNHYICRGTWSPVEIAGWRFVTSDRKQDAEEGYCVPGTTSSSWFQIAARHVPHLAGDASFNEASQVYGKFHRFIKLLVPGFHTGDQVHYLGECTLFAVADDSDMAQLPQIDLSQPLQYQDPHSGVIKQVRYVPLKHVAAMVALGPVVRGWRDKNARKQGDVQAVENYFFVLPLQL